MSPGRHRDGRQVDRRAFLGLTLGAAGSLLWPQGSAQGAVNRARRAATTLPAGSDLGAIDHVVFLMMENRSFDHYFGTYKGVRGFDDHPPHHLGVFSQPDPANRSRSPKGRLLPFHLDTVGTDNAECTTDLTHDWTPQHQCWNRGAMNRFVETHTETRYEGPTNGVLTMGYYTRQDLPYYYALADAFTIGDAYHCSVMGPTDPNRMMQMSGTIDPSGHHGGPVLTTDTSPQGMWSVRWDTMPEVLQDQGISWKYYRPAGDIYTLASMSKLGITYDTVLPYFAQYRSPTSPLHDRAFNATFPDDFIADLRAGTLPSVSWISAPAGHDDHPPAPPSLGMWFTDQVLSALVAHPKIWARTVMFFMYDENDGFFDHVAPRVPPPRTKGEYLSVHPLPKAAGGIDGPIGLGFRVPLLVLSPFARGGYVCSDLFDHTSQLRFLEERFGVKAPNVSAWRRKTVGDLTTTLHLSAALRSVPALPPTSNDTAVVAAGCSPENLLGLGSTNPPPLPATQSMPHQEPGRAKRLPKRSPS